MKRRSERLWRVKRLADSEERDHCRAMGRAQGDLDQQLRRLEELEAYRHEYANRAPRGGSVASAMWADYQNFLGRLDDAVAAQTQAVTDGRRVRDAHRQRWMVKRQRLESLDRVLQKSREAEARHHERLVQKALDDLPAKADPFGSCGADSWPGSRSRARGKAGS